MNFKPCKQGLVAVALTTLAALGAHSADAQSVFNTGAPTGSLIGANSIDATDWIAESFTLSAPTTITGVKAFVNSTFDDSDAGQPFTVALYAASGPAGAQLPDLNFFADGQNQLGQFTASYSAGGGWVGQDGLNWTLGAGTYFIAIETDGNGVQGLVLPTGDLGHLPGSVAFYTGGNGYASDPAVSTDAFGLQVSGVAAAVPEPATLAMMLLGLGAIGFLARRRKT